MNMTKQAITHARTTLLITLFVLVYGLYDFYHHPSKEDPYVIFRTVVIDSYFPGMPSKRVEQLITKKVEEKVRELSHLKEVKSYSYTGHSRVLMRIEDSVYQIQPMINRLRDKMEDIKKDLPKGVIGPEVRDEYGTVYGINIALTADGFSMREMEDFAKDIKDKLYHIKGVNKIELNGVQHEMVYLELSSRRLARYGISPYYIIAELKKQNIIMPGGVVHLSGRDIVLEPSGNLNQMSDIEDILLKLPRLQGLVKLSSLVKVKRGYRDPPHTAIYYNGLPSVVISVSMYEDYNIFDFGHDIKKLIGTIQDELPLGMNLHYATFQPDVVTHSMVEFKTNLYTTVGIVFLVAMLALGLRAGLIATMIIPLTLLLTVIVMNFFHIELHRISIAAMIISLGLLVDNGIVVTEDIKQRISLGEDKKKAAILSGQSLFYPLLTSSLTTIFAFLPLMLSDSTASEYLRSLSLVIAMALLSSWLIALTFTPLCCVSFLKSYRPSNERGKERKLNQLYHQSLNFWLNHRLVFIILLLLALVGSVWLLTKVHRQFFPSSDRAQFGIKVDLSPGSSFYATDKTIKSISQALNDTQKFSELKSNLSFSGFGGIRFYRQFKPSGQENDHGFIIVNVKSKKQVDMAMDKVRTYLFDHYPDIRAEVFKFPLNQTQQGALDVRIHGHDPDVLKSLADKVKSLMRQIPGTMDIADNWGAPIIKMKLKINQAKAKILGISSSDIARSLNTHISGLEISRFRDADDSIPIVLRSYKNERDRLHKLAMAYVYNETHKKIPLIQVASFQSEALYKTIYHQDGQRAIVVTGVNTGMGAQNLAKKMTQLLQSMPLPHGYWIDYAGEVKESRETNKKLFKFFPLCMMLIVILMALQFNSYRKTLLILLSIPPALIGAICGLYLCNASLGFTSILGMLSLIGIVVNNAIILIDTIDIESAKSSLSRQTLIKAATKRLQPILITTLTTILGLFPMLFFGGALWFGMACVIIFGLMFSTIVTLFFVPIVFSLFYQLAKP